MFIDTHSHLYLGELANHIPEAIEHLKSENFSHSIQIGTSLETSRKCIELARSYDIVRATVGVHPCEAQDIDVSEIPAQIEALEKMITENLPPEKGGKEKEGRTGGFVVGFGEIGFDHYHLAKDNAEAELQKARQIEWFHAQAQLALKYDLPVVIHTRNCSQLTLEELKKSGLKRFVIHCFSENFAFAESIFQLSDEAKISFTGILTYKKSEAAHLTAQMAPLGKIMIETDAPYIIPEQMKGKQKYCEPAFSKYVYETICELRSESPEEIEKQLWENSMDFFQLK